LRLANSRNGNIFFLPISLGLKANTNILTRFTIGAEQFKVLKFSDMFSQLTAQVLWERYAS
jgi:hypothetical protein